MRLLLVTVSVFIFTGLFCQNKSTPFLINDEWFQNYGSKGLQVGDLMPDIALSPIMNNKTGKKRFADFKGKLVILDFWDIYCTNCIKAFPKMEKLQKEFGDRIQVILVNVMQNESQILEWIKEKTRILKDFKMPDLPSIVSSRPYISGANFLQDPQLLYRYFPTTTVPHHVWIDEKGIVRLIGGPENTYEEKISDLLAGKQIQYLKSHSSMPSLNNDKNARLYQQLGFMKNTPVRFGSFITPYTNEITGISRQFVDSLTRTRISYFVNFDLIALYRECFNRIKNTVATSKLLFYPIAPFSFFEFPPGTDMLNYTADREVLQRQLTTEEFVRSKYCYEQVVPLAVTETERYQMMLGDLNRYFKVHYGITGSKQIKTVPCYELIRISDNDKIAATSNKNHRMITEGNGQWVFEFQGTLNGLFASLLLNTKFTSPQLLKPGGQDLLIANGTGWNTDKRIRLKSNIKGLQSINDLRQLLYQYGLDLVEKPATLLYYVFARVDDISN
jgi:thiol-disulfide isomerase/thioredoxin